MAVNENPAVHGLIVQLPLDSVHPMDSELVTNAVTPEKDVDGSASCVPHHVIDSHIHFWTRVAVHSGCFF